MIIQKEMSLVAALAKFREEAKGLNLQYSEYMKLLEIFSKAFRRSLDYDIALTKVFDEFNVAVSRKSQDLFKEHWKGLKDR
jgi:hypothetical protein